MTAILSMLFAIVVHELSHAFAATCLGCRVRGFKLIPYPAARIENPYHRGKNALIALAAPAMNLTAFVIFYELYAFGFRPNGIWAASQLIAAFVALVPYPGSDSWRALCYRVKLS